MLPDPSAAVASAPETPFFSIRRSLTYVAAATSESGSTASSSCHSEILVLAGGEPRCALAAPPFFGIGYLEAEFRAPGFPTEKGPRAEDYLAAMIAV